MARTPPQAASPRSPRRAARSPVSAAIAASMVAALAPARDAHAERTCEEWSADVTTVEGHVEVRHRNSARWTGLASGERVCTGAVLRSHGSSRALITLPDGGTVRLDENSTLSIPEPPAGVVTLIELLRGVIHIISRDPRFLQFSTPYANAGLEGTEFDIRVDDIERRTEILVLEGEVVVSTPRGRLSVADDHIAVAADGEAPTAAPYAQPIERMRWASYFPPLLDRQLPDANQEPTERQRLDAEFFAHRAAARLGTARIEAAALDIDRSLELDPANATALSLGALIALARADRKAAQERLAQALAADPRSVPALLASSHLEQSSLRLEAAERVLTEAAAVEPNNPLVLTRLAEIALARGDARRATTTAARARDLDPARGAPFVVLGFAHLRSFDARAAVEEFRAAVEREPQAPLPRLGLALALIQDDELVEGRRQLELAVTLDPANPLTRSYVAKVYDAENRGELTATQLELAKKFDPVDPTPWLYSAMHKLRTNVPVAALHDLRAAERKNGERPALRSWLALDEDVATRSSGLARVYDEIGFDRLVLTDAWNAVGADPGDFAAHRLLADGYANEPLHEVARVSELLMSQLLQPANVAPIKPQLGQQNLFIAQRLGPSYAVFDELTLPLAANGLKLRASAVGGGSGTAGHDFTLAGLHDRFSYSVGHYGFETDGFRANNDLEQRSANAFLQYRPTHDTTVQAELRGNRVDYGDLNAFFDRTLFSPLRAREDADSLRLGVKHQLAPGHVLLASAIAQEVTAAIGTGGALSLAGEQQAYSLDLQDIARVRRATIQSGVVATTHDEPAASQPLPPGIAPPTDETSRQLGAYSYVTFNPAPAFTVTAGASLYSVKIDDRSRDAANPKLGVVWRPTRDTTIRAAAFETLYNDLTTSSFNAQPRLEPTQVAGFTQLLLGARGDEATVRGLAIDQALTDDLFVGWQADTRRTESTGVSTRSGVPQPVDVTLRHRSQLLYLYWSPLDRLSFTARYEHSRSRSDLSELHGFSHVQTDRLPLELRYFWARGLTFGARASFAHQDGSFQTPAGAAPGEDRFWVMDAFVGYRLPNRRGLLSLNADNVLDEQFQFQDLDPTNPSLFPERMLSLRFTLAVE